MSLAHFFSVNGGRLPTGRVKPDTPRLSGSIPTHQPQRQGANMGKVKHIMAACDFSEYAPPVVSYAVDLARELKAKLVVVNIINQRDVDAVAKVEAEYPAFSVKRYLEDQEKARLQQMADLIRASGGDDIGAEKQIRVGVPFKTLLQFIEEEGIDLLVMGTKGRGNLVGVLFGSTAEKVWRRCPIPLLSIRTEASA
jgi:nucleotide-binding universal stress UspA family protein